ncbi:FAD-dependent oxidoreductase [Mycobacterium sp. CBMA247]|nr:FAD-dependent oxidoreductase [Mycolicibacterium sp. CBMA 329]MUL86963.1 FAD-dependent oxidoreductase [Mycolicibacterium sp. CBMA 331]MUM37260.1 FAD-dependent oxidoreductase [Mycolicibacterium sp. CBMA 247]MUM43028.1 FAD-dependent oxidoreductase [Mycolicibacterium sp. CBMA 294]
MTPGSAGLGHARADSLAGLRSAVRGRVLLIGDAGFDAARTPWNLAVDQSVRAVVDIVDAEDAAALIRFARNVGVPIAVQPNGHGASNALDGAILARTAALNETHVDTAAGTARVGPGVSWAQVQALASPAGLTGVAGSAPIVGITGYTLGGGLSWFSRKYGWAAESVAAFEVITANGDRLKVTDTSESDLFWALRGGGGDYALVTSVEFALKRAPSVYGGTMIWPVNRAAAVISAFREITAAAPDELTTWCSLTRFPGAPPLVRVDTTYLGRSDAAIALLQPFDRIDGLLSDTRRVLPVSDIGAITDEPTKPAPSRQQGTLVTGLTDQFIDALLTQSIEPLMAVQIRHLGGALERPSDTAAGPVTAPYLISFVGIQPNPESGTTLKARANIFLDTLTPVNTTKVPFNFLAPEQNAADAFDTATLARLRAVKQHRDPDGVFRSNHPVG